MQNKFKIWILASRPKTLFAGIVPVMVASALAIHDNSFCLLPAVLCLLFSLFSQIASNFGNDYYDFLKQIDGADRMGPARAVASGWVSPRAMRNALFIAIALACVFGLGLVFYGGWEMILVGAICVVALLMYSAGPFPLSSNGLGDLFVFVFFGLVAVVFSYFVQTGVYASDAFLCGAMVGLVATNILIVNNYRDYESDRKSKKNTTIVLFGRGFGQGFYLVNGLLAVALAFSFVMQGDYWAGILPLAYLPTHFLLWHRLQPTNTADMFNRLLAQTSANLLLFGILLSVGLLMS